MADILTQQQRSWNMSRIRGRDTAPEQLVRSLLHRKGFRFRVNDKRFPGRPDVVLPKFNAMIFVHGCFWHRHAGCKFAYTPKSNQLFWREKLNANVERDRRIARELRRAGWRVFTVWECDLRRDPTRCVDQLSRRLRGGTH